MPACCVPSCDSGSYVDKKKDRETGRRPKSFFVLPKDLETLQEWISVLNLKVDIANYEKSRYSYKICELHFKEEDVVKFDEVRLKDGTIYKGQRVKYKLRKGTVPIVRDENFLDNLAFISAQSGELSEEIVEMPDGEVQDSSTLNIIEELESKEEDDNTMDQSDNNAEESCFTLTENIIIGGSEIENLQEVLEKNAPLHEPLEKEVNGVRYIFTPIMLPTSQPFAFLDVAKEVSKEEEEEEEESYTFEGFLEILDTLVLPPGWAKNFQEQPTIVFLTYVHPLKLEIHLHVVIEDDMSIKICTRDKRVTREDHVRFGCPAEVIDYLNKVSRLRCCEGTGLKEVYAEGCHGFITDKEDEYKRSRGFQRCVPCRQFRNSFLRN